MHLLKQARPDLEIAVVAEERFAPVFENNPDIDLCSAAQRARPARLRARSLPEPARRHPQRAADAAFRRAIRAGFDIFRPGLDLQHADPDRPGDARDRTPRSHRRACGVGHVLSGGPDRGGSARSPYPAAGRSPTRRQALYAVIHPVAATRRKHGRRLVFSNGAVSSANRSIWSRCLSVVRRRSVCV